MRTDLDWMKTFFYNNAKLLWIPNESGIMQNENGFTRNENFDYNDVELFRMTSKC